VIERAAPSDETSEQLSIAAAFLRRSLRHWRTALGVLALGGAACAVFLFVRRPMFRSETVILYSAGPRADEDGERPDTARSVMFRLREILMSRSSLDSVVTQFDLYPEIRRARGPVDAVDELKKHIDFRAPGGDTFTISFVGGSPGEARDVTARLAEVVIGQDSELRRKQALLVGGFLDTEEHATEDALRSAELALASFMAAHPRFALDATPLATGAAIRATVADGSLPGAGSLANGHARSYTLPRRVVTAPSERTANPGVGEVSGDAREAILEEARARAALVAARANLADLAARFTAVHPDVRAAQSEVERATRRLAVASATLASAERQASSPAPAAQPTPSPVLGLPSILAINAEARPVAASAGIPADSVRPDGGLRPQESNVVALETEWVKLTRQTTEARQHQDQVEAALFKVKGAADSEQEARRVQVTLIDPAFMPQTAMPPGRAMVGALFGGASLLLAIGLAAMKALLDNRVYTGRDLGALAPILVLVPRRGSVAHAAGY
jgi:uncharacterized protein involved in exopolysaccharide biosynthesis